MSKLSEQEKSLKKKFNYHYKAFDKSKLAPDPLEIPHRFSHLYDIEVSAFIASLFAYGNVSQIMKTLNSLFEFIGESPYDFVMNFKSFRQKRKLENFAYRFYSGTDIITLFKTLNLIYTNYKSLNYLFILYHFPGDENIKNSLSFFSNNLKCISKKFSEQTAGIKFMFPDPYDGSACKRMNLFLRWMVRKDELDFGSWKEIAPNQLVIPVDTHIARLCKELGLTNRKNASWSMAEEITENLKLFDAKDPVKYDFAICHLGIRGLKI